MVGVANNGTSHSSWCGIASINVVQKVLVTNEARHERQHRVGIVTNKPVNADANVPPNTVPE